MKQKMVIIASVLTIALSAVPDAGAQWAEANGEAGGSVSCIAACGMNLFAGTQGAGGDYINGVYISTDSGISWALTSSQISSDVYALAVIDSTIFAGSENGVYRSTNNGLSWTAVNSNLPGFGARFLASIDTNLIAAGAGIFLSTNKGESWAEVNDGLPSSNPIMAVSKNNILAGFYDYGVYRSTNNGMNWISCKDTGLTSTNFTLFAIQDTDFLAGTFGGLFRSTD
jgi:hypothetical protein